MTPVAMPSLSAIQRTNMVLGCAAALALLVFRSQTAATSCLAGAGLVIANFYLLSVVVRVLLSGAASGMSAAMGAIALPLKLLLIAGLVYLALGYGGFDGIGFGLGVFTQFVAVLAQTAWVNLGAHSPEQGV